MGGKGGCPGLSICTHTAPHPSWPAMVRTYRWNMSSLEQSPSLDIFLFPQHSSPRQLLSSHCGFCHVTVQNEVRQLTMLLGSPPPSLPLWFFAPA